MIGAAVWLGKIAVDWLSDASHLLWLVGIIIIGVVVAVGAGLGESVQLRAGERIVDSCSNIRRNMSVRNGTAITPTSRVPAQFTPISQ